MILPGFSPIIRAGDSFDAEFTVRNASRARLRGRRRTRNRGLSLPPSPQKLELLARRRQNPRLESDRTDAVLSELRYRVDAAVADGPSDHLAVTQRVLPVVPVQNLPGDADATGKPMLQPVAMPADAIVGQGDVQVTLSPSLSAGLDGVREWMRLYPYTCLEQRVSRAVALRDPKLWDGSTADLPQYLDSDGLLKFFPDDARGQRHPHLLCALDCARGRACSSAAVRSSDGEGLERLYCGHRSFAMARCRVPTCHCAKSPLSRRSLGPARPTPRCSAASPIEPNLWPDFTVIQWWDILLRLSTCPIERVAWPRPIRSCARG